MVKLVQSKWLGRPIRSEGWDELCVPTGTKIKEAIEAGRKQEALELVDYLSIRPSPDLLLSPWVCYLLNHIADRGGEEKVYEVLRGSGKLIRGKEIELAAKLPVEERVRVTAQGLRWSSCWNRQKFKDITVSEYPDRYVISFDPCPSCGVIRRTRELAQLVKKTKRAYPWSWSKTGVPYYCAYCCVWGEILPTGMSGYPIRVCLFDDDPEKPCAWVFYKKPELIPEEYFTRIGKLKDPSKFKRG